MHKTQINEGTHFTTIAKTKSCFPDRRGVPRQPQLCPSTRAILQFDKSTISPASFDGIQMFSHLWILFVFHQNTNFTKDNTQSEKSPSTSTSKTEKKKRKKTFLAKIRPPQLGGKKIGIFATRTPHRPNPIGLSVVRILSVDPNERTITITGHDLVDGTPILDIKPYVKYADCWPEVEMPSLFQSKTYTNHIRKVLFLDQVRRFVENACATTTIRKDRRRKKKKNSLRNDNDVGNVKQTTRAVSRNGRKKNSHGGSRVELYINDPTAMLLAVEETLKLDIRSLHQNRGKADEVSINDNKRNSASYYNEKLAGSTTIRPDMYEYRFDGIQFWFHVESVETSSETSELQVVVTSANDII
eukprot:g2582.t1